MRNRTSLLILTLVLLLAAGACRLPAPGTAGNTDLPTAVVDEQPAPTGPTATPAPDAEYWQYWRVIEIAEYGVHIAVPCFWLAPTPEEIASYGGNFSIRNYDDAYAMSFPRSNPDDIWAAGGRKIDIGILDKAQWGAAPDATLEELTSAMYGSDSETQLISVQSFDINGAAALSVFTESTFGPGQHYLFELGNGYALLFGARFEDFRYDPDIQAILASVGTDGRQAVVPNMLPMAPPVGLTADCLPGFAGGTLPAGELPGNRTSCGLHSWASVDELVAGVEAGLQARDWGTLSYDGYINAPFGIGYWRSEGQTVTPATAATLFANTFLPAESSATLTFEHDPANFPIDFDFNPTATTLAVVYTTGWAADGTGAAFLYFTEDSCGGAR